MSSSKIRPFAAKSDTEAVAAIWREQLADAAPHNDPKTVIEQKLRTQPELFLVALANATVVGTVMGGFDGHRGWVYSLAVRSDHQRRGIGSALLNDLERRLQAIGCLKINLQIRATNHAVAQFYKSLGYQVEERISMGKRV